MNRTRPSVLAMVLLLGAGALAAQASERVWLGVLESLQGDSATVRVESGPSALPGSGDEVVFYADIPGLSEPLENGRGSVSASDGDRVTVKILDGTPGLGDRAAFSPFRGGEPETRPAAVEPLARTESATGLVGERGAPEERPESDLLSRIEERFSREELALAQVEPWHQQGMAEKAKARSRFARALRHDKDDPAKADYAAALELFEKSAKSGYAKAQYRLGRMYENGLGVEIKLDVALAWYRLAAAQENPEARLAVARMERGAGR